LVSPQNVEKKEDGHGHKKHPHTHYFDLINYAPLTPFDYFNHHFGLGFFNDMDLAMYNMRGDIMDNFGRLDNEFFGSEDFDKFVKEGKDGVFQKSKTVKKHTRVEDGKRTTITETKTVNPDGKVLREIKEETDDGKGNHQVRYLDALPDNFKKALKNSPQ